MSSDASTSQTTPATLPPTTTTVEITTPSEPSIADPAESLLAQMSIEEMVGQLFLARCPETDAIDDIQIYHLGGYILFGRDFKKQTPSSVRQTLENYQTAASVPMLIAVDEEGGTVNRVSSEATFRASPFPSPRSLYNQGGQELVVDTEIEKCQLLTSLGININMAPVCDITTDPHAFMYDRSLGLDAKETSSVICAMVATMKENHLGSVLKHFPGYGNNADTHIGIATDTRSYDQLAQEDLKPFIAGIQAGCDSILVSHTIVSALDEEYPASLSPEVHRFLRQKLHFQGVILTDDLSMQAISDVYGVEESAVLAVLAGNDLLCSSDYQVQYQAVLNAVQNGRISEEQIKESVLRILKWKADLGLLD